MKMGLKMRIYPTKEQEELLFYYCRVAHDMQNFLVAKYKDKLPSVNIYGIIGYTPRDLITEFGKEIPQRVAYGAMTQYAAAVNRVYKKIGNASKFHKYNPKKQSFYVKSKTIKIEEGTIICPTVRGYKMTSKKISVDTQYVEKYNVSEIIEPRFTHRNGKWYVSGCYNVSEPAVCETDKYLGLDWGVKTFVTTSDGEFINYPATVLREYQRIRKLQSIRDKKRCGSNNWIKINLRLDAAFERLENLKKNFIDQTTTRLCRDTNIVVEDLEHDFLFSKSFMRRMYMIAPRNRFYEKLEWKCKKFGTQYIVVSPSYTSQVCSVCGMKHDLTLKDRVMECECGNIMDRDVNAAINIRKAASAAMGVCCT